MKKQTKDQEIQAENVAQVAPDVEEVTAPGKEEPQVEQDRGKTLAEAAASFAAACEAVKEKKRRAFARFQALDRKRNGQGLERITLPDGDPFDLDALRRAAQETGSPQEIKEWIALARAIATPIYRDSEFLAACVEAVQTCAGPASQQDEELSAELAALEQERARTLAAYDRKLAAVRAARNELRSMIYREILGRAKEADGYLLDQIPQCFAGDKGARNIGLVYGVDMPVKEQLNSFMGTAEAMSRTPEGGDPYAHLKNLPGSYVPGLHNDVTAVLETPSGADSSSGKRSFFDWLRGR